MSRSSIPEEIQVENLLRLPVKSIFRFKCVCKSWYTYIRSPKFVSDHLILTNKNPQNSRIMIRYAKHQDEKDMFYSVDYDSILTALTPFSTTSECDGAVLMDYPTVKIKNGIGGRFTIIFLGSCNGLLCLGANYCSTLILWNPATKEYKEIILPDNLPFPYYGFGYDHKINDYKLVCITSNEVSVYTLKLNTWRSFDTIPYDSFVEYGGLLLNGRLHYTGATNDIVQDIVAFDISSEKFINLPIPEEFTVHPKRTSFCALRVLGNSLCFVCSVMNVRVDVWVMQNYGVTEPWTKLFTTTQETITTKYPGCLKLYWTFKDGEILIQVGDGFVLYDQPKDIIRFLNFNGIGKFGYLQSSSYVESLVPLNSRTYTGKKCQQKRKRLYLT